MTARVQTAGNSRRNYFACGKPELIYITAARLAHRLDGFHRQNPKSCTNSVDVIALPSTSKNQTTVKYFKRQQATEDNIGNTGARISDPGGYSSI